MKRHILVIAATACLAFSSIVYAKLYRWVDDEGNVHYSDQVPPEHSSKGHAELNEQGMTVEERQAAKDREEVLRERELARQKEEENRRIEAAQQAERELLASFRTVDDLMLARNGKLSAVDFEINVKFNQLNRLKAQLATARAQAEKEKKKKDGTVDPALVAQIDDLTRQIGDAYKDILLQQEGKEQIIAKYAVYLERYRAVNRLPEDAGSAAAATYKPDESLTHNTVVECEAKDICSKQWEKALAYTREHMQTPIILESDNLLVTAHPGNSQEIGVSVARVARTTGDGQRLFLDVQCSQTLQGNLVCAGSRVAALRSGFRETVTGDASNASQK